MRIKISENSKGNGDVSAGTNPKVICGKVIVNNKNFSNMDFNGRNLKGKLYMLSLCKLTNNLFSKKI
tara:strand:- start:119 stop:319 length:201 start_codon:yes stop_codon:yes gene_type:complete